MTKLLDLDSILPPKKSIKFGGQEYPIVEMTVGLFVSIKQMEGKDLQNMSPVSNSVWKYHSPERDDSRWRR